MKPSEVLRTFKWTRNSNAKTTAGKSCNVNSPEAAKFCVQGAILRAYPHSVNKRRTVVEKLLTVIRAKYDDVHSLSGFNDVRVKDKRVLIRLLEKIGE
jgi:hypothetical protein